MRPKSLIVLPATKTPPWAPVLWFFMATCAILAPALAETSVDESQEKAPPASETPAATEATPDAEGWLLDAETGQRYRIEKLPKVEGAYQWIGENKVLMPAGAQFEVVKHDDESFWVKYFEPKYVRREIKDKGPTAAELAAAAATYTFELKASDRLQFEEFDHGLPESGQWRNGFDVADMNGDGHLDLVFGPSRKGRAHPNVFLGDGHGNWERWQGVEYPSLPYDYGDVEAADFNGDGLVDLAFGIHLRGMAVIVRDGDARFVPWSEGIGLHGPGEAGFINAFSSRALESVDWNGDGKLDVVAMGEGPKGPTGRQGRPNEVVESSRGFLVYLNRGDGSWSPWRPLQDPEMVRPNFGDDFLIADVNGDQRLDLLSVSRQMANKQILNLGIGDGKVAVAELAEVRPRSLVTAVAAAELDDRPGLDLVVGYSSRELDVWRTGIDVLYGGPEATWKRRTLYSEEGRRGITALAAGDLDGDGHTDLAATTGEGEVWVFLGDGDGFFLREEERLMPPEKGCRGFGLELLDLDGDGRDELIASFAGEPAGLPGIPGLSHPGCTKGGSVRVWTPRPAAAPTAGP